MTQWVKIETWPSTYTATDNDTGVKNEPKTITITVTGNDAPVAKDATETTEKHGAENGNVPAATDVDGTVSYPIWLMMWPSSLTFNDDSCTFTQAATSMTCQWVKIETWPSHTPRPTTTQAASRRRAHRTVTGGNDAPVAKTRLKRPKEKTRCRAAACRRPRMDGTVESYQLVDDDVTEGNRRSTMTLHIHSGSVLRWLPPSGQDRAADLPPPRARQRHRRGGRARDITITVTNANDAPVTQGATETTEETRYWTATMPAATVWTVR